MTKLLKIKQVAIVRQEQIGINMQENTKSKYKNSRQKSETFEML